MEECNKTPTKRKSNAHDKLQQSDKNKSLASKSQKKLVFTSYNISSSNLSTVCA